MPSTVIIKLKVNEDWKERMIEDGMTEWVGFLANRVQRGIAGRAEVVNVYTPHESAWEEMIKIDN